MANSLTKIDDRGLKTPIDLLDNEKIRFGTGNDLEIYHNGSNNYIVGASGQNTYIGATNGEIQLQPVYGTDHGIRVINNGAVELYYDGSKKLETYSSGVKTYGGYLRIVGDEGGTAELNLYADEGDDAYDMWQVKAGGSSDFYIAGWNGGANETSIKATGNGAVELYYDNVKKLYTDNGGVVVNGNLYLSSADNYKAIFGAGQDLQIYHDGSDSFITNATNIGWLRLYSGIGGARGIIFKQNDGSEEYARMTSGGSVDLYYDNSKKAETTSGGFSVTGELRTTTDLVMNSADNQKIYLGAGNDLQIYHDGSASYIDDAGTGILRVRGNEIRLCGITASETFFTGTENGAAKLYYDDVVKFETLSQGTKTTGIHSLNCTGNRTLHVQTNSGGNIGSLAVENNLASNSSTVVFISTVRDSSSSEYFLQCNRDQDNNSEGVAASFTVATNGNVKNSNNSYGSISDLKLKENIVDASSQWDDIKNIKIRNFNFKTNPSEKLLGVVAQEVETVSAGLVEDIPDKDITKEGDEGTTTKSVKYSVLYMKAVKALQEAITRIETLETEVAALKAK